MYQEQHYVNFFYEKYEGRVAIGVGYNRDLSEIYLFVFENTDGNSIGIAALAVYTHKNIDYVHIYHLGSFKNYRGNGNKMLEELCFQADRYQIILSLSPIIMPNRKNESMTSEGLSEWYGRFGFKGSAHFKREPIKI
jgi:hypothetical protein